MQSTPLELVSDTAPPRSRLVTSDLGPRRSGSVRLGASRGLHRKLDRADGSMAERSGASRDDVSNDHDVAVDAAAADEATGDGALG